MLYPLIIITTFIIILANEQSERAFFSSERLLPSVYFVRIEKLSFVGYSLLIDVITQRTH